MRRYLGLGFGALLALSIALAVYGAREETRLAQAQASLRAQSVGDAAAIYVENCAVCHGAEGEGLAVPLNTPEVRAKDAATLARTITEGVPGTMMAPWGKTLEQPEIDALVTLLQHWDQLATAGVALEAPAPQAIDLSDPQAVLALGERLFVSTCTSCHGERRTPSRSAPATRSSWRASRAKGTWS